jgi:hypothetical protein
MPPERNVATKFSYDTAGELSFYYGSENEDYLENALYIPETGALLTMQSAVALIYRYCNTLPADGYVHPRPVFEFENSRCCLHLPSNAPFRDLYSPISKSEKRSKALVSLEACRKLKLLNHLDEHLRPFNYRTEILGELAPEVDSNGMVIGSKRRHNMYENRTPQLWKKNAEAGCKVIAVEDDPNLLKARKDVIVEQLEIRNKQNTRIESSAQTLTNMDMQNQQSDDNSTISDEINTSNANMTENDTLNEKSFCYWGSIFEVTTDDNKIDGVPYRQLCILTRKPMPPLPRINLLDRSQQIHVNTHTINIKFVFNEERSNHLCNYMLNVMKSLLNKDFACSLKDIPYFTVPLVKGSINQLYNSLTKEDLEKLIDWVEISNIVELKSDHFSPESEISTEDIIIIDYSNDRRKYRIDSIHRDLSITSPVPADITVRESGHTSFQEYYIENKKPAPSNLGNPMTLGRQIQKRLNYITASSLTEPKTKGGAYAWLVSEFCKKYYMRLSVYQALLIIPALMTRIDSLLLLQEAKLKFKLDIKDNLMLEAYTIPCASMEMNYERLEMLGGNYRD